MKSIRLLAPIIVLLALVVASLACDIDQNFGAIEVGDTPRQFSPAIAENHSWLGSVSPNTNYEVIIRVTQGSLNERNSLYIKDRKGLITYAYRDSVITVQTSVSIAFVGPSDGNILILFIPGKGQATCTIELRKRT